MDREQIDRWRNNQLSWKITRNQTSPGDEPPKLFYKVIESPQENWDGTQSGHFADPFSRFQLLSRWFLRSTVWILHDCCHILASQIWQCGNIGNSQCFPSFFDHKKCIPPAKLELSQPVPRSNPRLWRRPACSARSVQSCACDHAESVERSERLMEWHQVQNLSLYTGWWGFPMYVYCLKNAPIMITLS